MANTIIAIYNQSICRQEKPIHDTHMNLYPNSYAIKWYHSFCGQRPQHLRTQEAICSLWLLHYVIAEGHNN